MRRSVLVNVPLSPGLDSRQNHIRKLASLAEEDSLHDKEFKASTEHRSQSLALGINQAHLFAEKVHCLKLAFVVSRRSSCGCRVPAFGGNVTFHAFFKTWHESPDRLLPGSRDSNLAWRHDRWRPAHCYVRARDRRPLPDACSYRSRAANWRLPSRCPNPWCVASRPFAQRTQHTVCFRDHMSEPSSVFPTGSRTSRCHFESERFPGSS